MLLAGRGRGEKWLVVASNFFFSQTEISGSGQGKSELGRLGSSADGLLGGGRASLEP